MSKDEKVMSNVDLKCIAYELKEKLVGSWVQKIYQLNGNLFSFIFRKPGEGKLEFIVDLGKRCNVTSLKWIKKKIASTFPMALRKYLRNSLLEDFSQVNFDRILKLSFSKREEKFFVYIEMFRDGNIILTDGENKILHALREHRFKHRVLRRNETYSLPPNDKIDIFNNFKMELLNRKETHGNLDLFGFLYKNLNLGPREIEEICCLSKVDKKRKIKNICEEEFRKVLDGIEKLKEKIMKIGFKGYVYFSNGEKLDYSPLKLEIYGEKKHVEKESLNEAIDYFFYDDWVKFHRENHEEEKDKKIIKHLRKAINEFLEKAKECIEKANLIYSHLTEIEEDLSLIKEGKEYIHFPLVQANLKGNKAILKIEGRNLEFNLNEKPTETAETLYLIAKKLKRKVKGAEKKLAEKSGERKPRHVKKGIGRLKRIKGWFTRYHWFVSSDKLIVIAGRNRKQNEEILRKHLTDKDIFLHADIHGAPFVIVKVNNEKVNNEKTLREAAILAASYSSAWKIGLNTVDVYYVSGTQVKISAPSGEYLPSGSVYIEGKRNYIRNVRLGISVCVRSINREVQILVKPCSERFNFCELGFNILPGNYEKSNVINFILKEINQAYNIKSRKLKNEIKEYLYNRLPSGKMQIENMFKSKISKGSSDGFRVSKWQERSK